MNAFGQWMKSRALRNADVAHALGLNESTTIRWGRDAYWPSSRDTLLQMIKFSGGAVTADMLLGVPARGNIRSSREAALGREALRTAQKREQRNGKKTKASSVKDVVEEAEPGDAPARRRAGA
jgi:hypothetical protein